MSHQGHVAVEVLSCVGQLLELNVSFGDRDARQSQFPLGTEPSVLGAFCVEVLYHAELQHKARRDPRLSKAVERAMVARQDEPAMAAATAVAVSAVAPEVAAKIVIRSEQTYRSEAGVYFTYLFQLRQVSQLVAPGMIFSFPSCIYAEVQLQMSARRALSSSSPPGPQPRIEWCTLL